MHCSVKKLVGSTFLPTHIGPLDDRLHGGLPSKSVTEVVGPPGAGKTQFCHMMAILASLPLEMGGLAGSVVYLDTEGSFSAERLVEMACNKFPDFFNTDDSLTALAESVLVYYIKSTKELMDTLASMENVIIASNVKLIILDSVASSFRREFDKTSIAERQALLIDQAQTLKKLTELYNIPCLVSNQVTANISDSTVTAALGPMWAHAVNTRLVLECIGGEGVGSRRLHIAKSPIAPVCYLDFDIGDSGLICASDHMEMRPSNYWGTKGAIVNNRADM